MIKAKHIDSLSHDARVKTFASIVFMSSYLHVLSEINGMLGIDKYLGIPYESGCVPLLDVSLKFGEERAPGSGPFDVFLVLFKDSN